MAAGDVPLVCYFNGKLVDEDKDAKYIGGSRKGVRVPKSISFASFKEKIQEIINLPSNGMEIKIKCGVRFDKSTLIGIDVDDDESLRFVMNESKFIMAYILEHGPPVTKHYEVNSDDISGADENYQDDMGERVDASSLHVMSQPKFDSRDGGIIEMLGIWEGMDTNMFSQPNADHHDEGINFSICNHGLSERNEVDLYTDFEEYQDAYPTEERVPPSDIGVRVRTSEHEPALLEFSDFGLALGREFPNIDALRSALSDMAVMTGREYKHVRTSPSQLTMKCSSNDCDWRIHATRLPNSPTFKVVKYQEVHTCMVRSKSGNEDHPQATVRWILSKMQSSIEKDPSMEPRKIVMEIKSRYGVLISYNKSVKAKTKALQIMRNQLKEPHIERCRALKEELERGGSICRLGLSADGTSFQHLFWAFPACVDALNIHLRPVVYVSMVHTQIGVLMYARGVDGNSFHGDPLEVGFALYIAQDDKAWETFLGWLKESVLPPTAGNRSNIIPFTVVTSFEETAVTRAVQNVLPHVHHFFFPKHIAEFLSKKFKSPQLGAICLKACESYSAEECEEYLQWMNSANEEAHEWLASVGSKSHWAVAFSPNKHACAQGLVWSHPDFEVIQEKLSIFEIVESSRDMVARYFSERQMMGAQMTTCLTPGVMKAVDLAKKDLHDHEVKSLNEDKYQVRVTVGDKCRKEVVDLEDRSCTCCRFQDTGYPCDHVKVTIVHEDLDISNYIHTWFTLDTYRATYVGSLPPPLSNISQGQTAYNEGMLPPIKRARVGRPKR